MLKLKAFQLHIKKIRLISKSNGGVRCEGCYETLDGQSIWNHDGFAVSMC